MPYKNKTSGVYVITNEVTGEQYVGSTVNLENRWYIHKHDAKRGRSFPLGRAIRKYGAEVFTYEWLEKCSKGRLKEYEAYWIGHLGTLYPEGYNVGSFQGAPTRDILNQIPEDRVTEIGPYLREANIRNRRKKDPVFDVAERERRSKITKKVAKKMTQAQRKANAQKAAKTFKKRMREDPEFAAHVRANRSRAGKKSQEKR